ncbi:hypothetical protein NC653_026591 [Populus alba x Populus x berolinensis]|uniref:Reverse transcriptase zinc-binding domain-containing protein n=1 Tax=Populus alba x Populus x berolinensis TaxID=444605 RepID=A0AAD6MEU6_9ROSI|nr:hypothetical protein NC653_026591 [Populus alba x Populus x berolinensis]
MFNAWPATHATFEPRNISDHSAIVVRLHNLNKQQHSSFKFLNIWAERSDFLATVASSWQEPVFGNPMFQFTTKLRRLKTVLRQLHLHHTSSITHRVTKAKTNWEAAQFYLDQHPTSSTAQSTEREMVAQYMQLCKDEESYFKQKSRVQWLQLGDRNTSFFHKSLLHRQVRKKIHSLQDETDNKSPGPDGYNALFFKKSWEIIKDDFTAAISLDNFSQLSGLHINLDKSSLYLSGIDANRRSTIVGMLGIQKATLPVRYLGVPLISTRLTHTDCIPLMERIIARIKLWTSTSLTYAGRLQLIKSVLFSIQVYWSSIFILPSATIKKIERTLTAFLWRGTSLSHAGAKVAWHAICYPLNEGGLGIKKLKHWNQAATIKHIWHLLADRNSIWAAWIHTILLRGRSFWQVKMPSNPTWSWRKILQSREWCRGWFIPIIGNGSSTFLWYDYWLPMGRRLIDAYTLRSLTATSLPWNATVSDIIVEGQWNFPTDTPILQNNWNSIVFNPKPWLEDTYMWKGHSSGKFSIASAWELLRDKRPLNNLHKLLWFSGHIPRQSFILWLAGIGRLRTMDRLQTVGIIRNATCILCSCHIETHDHLFFACPITKTVWETVNERANIYWPCTSWQNLLQWASATYTKKNDIQHTIARLMLSATVYLLWQKRNKRVFNNHFQSTTTMVEEVFQLVRTTISTMKFKDIIPITICHIWGIMDLHHRA